MLTKTSVVPVSFDQLRDSVVDLSPRFGGSDGGKLIVRNFDRQVHLAAMPNRDEPAAPIDEFRAQESRHVIQRIHGCRQTDALRPRAVPLGNDEPFKAGKRHSQVRAALVIGHCMNLVNDHRADGSQNLAALLRCQQDKQRLRRRNQDVWWFLRHALPLIRLRVASAQSCADGLQFNSVVARQLAHLSQRPIKVLLDIV